jgi:hypothetical protein
LTYGVRGFSPWLTGTIAFKPVARQKYQRGRVWWWKAVHVIAARKQRRIEAVARAKTYPSKAHHQGSISSN